MKEQLSSLCLPPRQGLERRRGLPPECAQLAAGRPAGSPSPGPGSWVWPHPATPRPGGPAGGGPGRDAMGSVLPPLPGVARSRRERARGSWSGERIDPLGLRSSPLPAPPRPAAPPQSRSPSPAVCSRLEAAGGSRVLTHSLGADMIISLAITPASSNAMLTLPAFPASLPTETAVQLSHFGPPRTFHLFPD